MKKLLITTALIGVATTSVLGSVALAQDLPVTKPTEGKIQFTVDPDEKGTLVKPNPEREGETEHEYIDIPEGASTSGPLRIQFVPNLDFGIKNSVSANAMNVPVLPLAYQRAVMTPPGPESTTGYKVAPFVQVTDNRGLSDEEFALNGWQLTVWATEFSTDPTGTAAAHVLMGSRINLKGSTLTTTNGTSAEVANLVAGHDPAAGTIPTDSGSPLVVLASKRNTNGHQISNVFLNNYKKGTTPGATIEGVEFFKKGGIAPQKDKVYKTVLTWTLSEGP